MDLLSLPDDWYGPATDAIRGILARAAAISCFERRPSSDAWDDANALVCSHLTALRQAMPSEPVARDVEVSVIVGEWSRLRQSSWMDDAYVPWGDRWAESERLLGVCSRMLGDSVTSSEQARSLLLPPIWPVPGVCNIYDESVVMKQGLMELDRLNLPERDRTVAQSVLWRAASAVWDAALWELALGARAIDGASPFDPLVGLYELGLVPLGWTESRYELFVLTST